MSFFGKDTTPRKIKVDPTTLTSDSDEVRSRLARIGANYERLSEILGDLEAQIATDDRLNAINESIDDAALESVEERKSGKQKWRVRSSKSDHSRRPRKSARPNKPR